MFCIDSTSNREVVTLNRRCTKIRSVCSTGSTNALFDKRWTEINPCRIYILLVSSVGRVLRRSRRLSTKGLNQTNVQRTTRTSSWCTALCFKLLSQSWYFVTSNLNLPLLLHLRTYKQCIHFYPKRTRMLIQLTLKEWSLPMHYT